MGHKVMFYSCNTQFSDISFLVGTSQHVFAMVSVERNILPWMVGCIVIDSATTPVLAAIVP